MAAAAAEGASPAAPHAGSHAYLQAQYGPRAQDYLTSATHAEGADLDQIEALVARRPGVRVLDLGCGGGHVAYRAAAHAGLTIAADVTHAMAELVRNEASRRALAALHAVQADAAALPFADGAFDAVLCRFSAHHWPDLDGGLREARRVLAPGGIAIFADTIAPEPALLDTHLQTIELLRDPSHVRNYRAGEWVAAAARAGFTPTGVTARRLRLDFAPWTARTRTGPARIAALQELQRTAPPSARRHFAIEPDGSFTIDKLLLELAPAPR